jgi:hypothetical protein
MTIGTSVGVAAIALLTSVSVAGASGSGMSKSTTGSSSSVMSPSDTLVLSSAQQKTAWQDISAHATKEKAPTSFAAKVGAAIPSSIMTHPVPASTANKVPELRPYEYALLNSNKLLIVNPNDQKVAGIITQ